MDTEKLLRVMADLLKEEEDIKTQAQLVEIRARVVANNADGVQNARSLTDKLEQDLKSHISPSLSASELSLLKKVGGAGLFGTDFLDKVRALVGGPTYVATTALEQLRVEREAFLNKAKQLKKALEDVGIVPHRPQQYEVGLVLPNEEGDFDDLAKRMKEFRRVLIAVVEAVDGDQAGVRITRVSSGSIDLFSLQPYEIAATLMTLLDYAAKGIQKIARLRQKSTLVDQDSDLDDEAKANQKAELEKQVEREKARLQKDIPDEIAAKVVSKKKDGEVQNRVRVAFRLVLAWLEVGVEFDITPVRTGEFGKETTENEVAQHDALIELNARQLPLVHALAEQLKTLELPPIEDEQVTPSAVATVKPNPEKIEENK